MNSTSPEADKKLLTVASPAKTAVLDRPATPAAQRALVAGWFSFEQGHATAGDLLAQEVTCEWLEQAGYTCDVALDPPFQGGLNWRSVDPSNYSLVVFVCGPFEQGELEAEFLSRFNSCRLIGLDLTMLLSLDTWNPFDLLLERDSSRDVRPDITFLSRKAHVPIVGLCLVEPYPGALDHVANTAIERLIASREMAVVAIDTRLDTNSTGLRTPAEIESLLARMDVVITTRLHGTVLALKNGVPVLPIDPEAGGAKIRRQVEKIGWPVIFTADAIPAEALQEAFNYCLTPAARLTARECRDRAVKMVQETRAEFITALTRPEKLEHTYLARLAAGTGYDWSSKKPGDIPAGPAGEPRAPGWKQRGQKLLNKGKELLKLAAWWTLPAPISRRLETWWQREDIG